MGDEKVYELADIGERFIALIIDSFIVGALSGIIGAGGGNLLTGGSALGFLIGVGFQWYFLTQHTGQTPGKMVMNLRVVKVDGTPITDSDAVLRYIGYLINSAIIGIGWLWAFIDGNKQGWHDKLAKTYVVKVSDEEKEEKAKRKEEKAKRNS